MRMDELLVQIDALNNVYLPIIRPCWTLRPERGPYLSTFNQGTQLGRRSEDIQSSPKVNEEDL